MAETKRVNVPILIGTSVAGKNVLCSSQLFIKVIESTVAYYESDSSVCALLHMARHTPQWLDFSKLQKKKVKL